ncbi:MAG TPA: GTP-binding protein, partial [Clostridia bacterium]|nr:GTP-binding protein [Clostridia bacterium]
MAVFETKSIRNIALLGHGGDGKTTLAEAMLFLTGAIDRMGKVDDGTTTLDYDPEEIKRRISISLGLAPVEYKGNKINVIDVPGYFDFVGEMIQALAVADSACIVCNAVSGLMVGTEKAITRTAKAKLPRIIFI